MRRDRDQPRTAQDWEDFLSSFQPRARLPLACWGFARTRQTQNNEWDALVQRYLDAHQFTSSILRLADKFKHLDTPVI